MLKSLKTIKNYYKTANISWIRALTEFIILLIPSILSIISPILTAEIISSITVYDFSRANKLLIIDFIFILITSVFYFCYHFLNEKNIKCILWKINSNVYNMVKENPKRSFVTSSIMNDIWKFSKFNSNFLYKICFFIKSIVILIIISIYSPLASGIIISVSILSALLLSFTNSKIQKHSFSLSEKKVSSFELFNNIQRGIKIDGNEKIEAKLKNKFFNSLNEMSSLNSKISLFYNFNNNFITLILKFAVFGLTFYFISLIKTTGFTLSVFLILTPYLTSSAQNLIEFFSLFSEIGIIQNILNEFEELKTKEEPLKNKNILPSNFNIKIQDLKLSLDKNEKVINLSIFHPSIAMLIFENPEKKKKLFDIILMREQAQCGTIFLGDKPLESFQKNDLEKYFSVVTNSPYFYNASILENLLAIEQSKTKIKNQIKNLGLEEILSSLPDKLETTINENTNSTLLFFLGLLRSSLCNPKIMLIYEIPNEMTKHDIFIFSQILDFLSEKCTIFLFLHKKIENFKSDILFFYDE